MICMCNATMRDNTDERSKDENWMWRKREAMRVSNLHSGFLRICLKLIKPTNTNKTKIMINQNGFHGG